MESRHSSVEGAMNRAMDVAEDDKYPRSSEICKIHIVRCIQVQDHSVE